MLVMVSTLLVCTEELAKAQRAEGDVCFTVEFWSACPPEYGSAVQKSVAAVSPTSATGSTGASLRSGKVIVLCLSDRVDVAGALTGTVGPGGCTRPPPLCPRRRCTVTDSLCCGWFPGVDCVVFVVCGMSQSKEQQLRFPVLQRQVTDELSEKQGTWDRRPRGSPFRTFFFTGRTSRK